MLACLLADLMYVDGRSITLSMSLPVVLAAAILYPPGVAALIAFLGSLDPREVQGKSSVERILFNRSQVALSAATASLVKSTLWRQVRGTGPSSSQPVPRGSSPTPL